jgi:Cys-tRNA(Pro) deacylase
MSRKEHAPETPATAFLRQHGVSFSEHLYDYMEHGGTAESSKQLDVPEHAVVKTLVMQDQDAKPLIILMHGDRQVSLKNLARQIGAKRVEPCKPEVAQRQTGYQVGGTSPFGLRKAMAIFVERSILSLPLIYINGGGRGFLVSLSPQVLINVLQAQPVDCAASESI